MVQLAQAINAQSTTTVCQGDLTKPFDVSIVLQLLYSINLIKATSFSF